MSAQHRTRHETANPLVFALGLMVATYAAFSVRTLLDTVNPGDLFSAKRLVATGAGAVLFILAARRIGKASRQKWTVLLSSALLWCVGGALALLAVRVGYDLLFAADSDWSFQRNLRWVIAWFGYFAAAMAGYCASLLASRRRPTRSWSRQEVTNAMIAETQAWSVEERRRLIAALKRVDAYEEADPIILRGTR